MGDKVTEGRVVRVLATAGWVVIVVAGMRAAGPLLVPLILSIFLALICEPAVLWLQRKRLPSGVAVPLVIAGVILLGLALGAIAGASLSQFSQALPRYQAHLHNQMTQVLQWLGGLGLELSGQELLAYVDPSAAMRLGARMLSGLGQLLSNSFLILLTVTFILFEASAFRRKLLAIWGHGTGSLDRFTKFAEDVYQFLAIKTLVGLATGIVVGLWVGLLGVDFPVLWGLLAFLLNYVPNLGSIIAAAPAVLLALIQFGPGLALIVVLGYVVVNVVFGNLVEPKLMGRRLGLSTLTVFLSLVFWGWVLGPVGMILSVPLTMILKIALESGEETKWIAILLGPSAEVSSLAPAVDEPDPPRSPP